MIATSQSIIEQEQELIRIFENGKIAMQGDSASVEQLLRDHWNYYSPTEYTIPDEDNPDFTVTVAEAINDILEKGLKKATAEDHTMQYPFEELAKTGIKISTSIDKRIRVFSWDDMKGGTMRFYRNVIQYYINDSISGCYFPFSWMRSREDEILNETSVDSIFCLYSGVYLMRGSTTSATKLHGENVLAFDISSGVMKKAYPFKTIGDEGDKYASFLSFSGEPDNFISEKELMPHYIIDNERIIIPLIDTINHIFTSHYTELYYNGVCFETLEEKTTREAKGEEGRFMIASLIFKDGPNTCVLDEVYPAPISLIAGVTHTIDNISELEGELVDLSIKCDAYKGKPTIKLPYIPTIDGAAYVENINLFTLAEEKTRTRWKFWKRFGQQKVLQIAGQDEGMPWQKLRYTAIYFNRLPSKKTAKQIHWAIEVEGEQMELLDTAIYKGMQIQLTMRPEWRYHKVKILSFMGNHVTSEAATHTTSVIDMPSWAFEGGLSVIGPEYATITYGDDDSEKEISTEEPDEFDLYLMETNKPWNANDTINIPGLDLDEMLQQILPEVTRYAVSDSTELFYNNIMRIRFPNISTWWTDTPGDSTQIMRKIFFDEEQTPLLLVVGKFIDEQQTFAISYEISEGMVQFYRLDNGIWKNIGEQSFDGEILYNYIHFENLDYKPGYEVVLATGPNMNANQWMKAFRYNALLDSMEYAGDFCTDYKIGFQNGTAYMTEEYSGSWYMDPHKTLYIWKNDKLIPIRQSELVVPGDMKSRKTYIEYYENPDYTVGGLQLKLRERYKEQNTRHKKYWDDFFEWQIP